MCEFTLNTPLNWSFGSGFFFAPKAPEIFLTLFHSMAPKSKQLLLSFAPRAGVPERRSEGAILVPRADATMPPPNDQIAMGPEPSPAKKPRRDLSPAGAQR